MTYPLDKAIQPLNNWGLMNITTTMTLFTDIYVYKGWSKRVCDNSFATLVCCVILYIYSHGNRCFVAQKSFQAKISSYLMGALNMGPNSVVQSLMPTFLIFYFTLITISNTYTIYMILIYCINFILTREGGSIII